MYHAHGRRGLLVRNARDDVRACGVEVVADREQAAAALATATDIAAMLESHPDAVPLPDYRDRLEEAYTDATAAQDRAESAASHASRRTGYARRLVTNNGFGDSLVHRYGTATYDDLLAEMDVLLGKVRSAAAEVSAATARVEQVHTTFPYPSPLD